MEKKSHPRVAFFMGITRLLQRAHRAGARAGNWLHGDGADTGFQREGAGFRALGKAWGQAAVGAIRGGLDMRLIAVRFRLGGGLMPKLYTGWAVCG